MYYNTTHLTGPDLKQAVTVAANQDEAITLIYRTGKPYSPSEIMKLCERAGHNWPITSIRRSITGLTDREVLRHTGVFKNGMYGRPEGVWIINEIKE